MTTESLASDELLRLRRAVESTTDLITFHARGGRMLFANQAARELIGLGPHEPLPRLEMDEFFVTTPNYAFEVDVTAWGWIHLLLGLLVAFAGYALFAAKTWARVVGVTLATLSAIANFFFIPYYPFWAILMISLAVWVIWSLTRSVSSPEELAA